MLFFTSLVGLLTFCSIVGGLPIWWSMIGLLWYSPFLMIHPVGELIFVGMISLHYLHYLCHYFHFIDGIVTWLFQCYLFLFLTLFQFCSWYFQFWLLLFIDIFFKSYFVIFVPSSLWRFLHFCRNMSSVQLCEWTIDWTKMLLCILNKCFGNVY